MSLDTAIRSGTSTTPTQSEVPTAHCPLPRPQKAKKNYSDISVLHTVVHRCAACAVCTVHLLTLIRGKQLSRSKKNVL